MLWILHRAQYLRLTLVQSELPSYDLVIPSLLEVGIDGLKDKCSLTPSRYLFSHDTRNVLTKRAGIPLKPMLAKPTKAIGEVLDRFENKPFTCEYKYDGERAQVCIFVVCVNGIMYNCV